MNANEKIVPDKWYHLFPKTDNNIACGSGLTKFYLSRGINDTYTFGAMFVLFWWVFGAVYFTYTANTPRKYRKKESAGGLDIQNCKRTPCFDTDVRLWNVLSTSKTPRIFNQANVNKKPTHTKDVDRRVNSKNQLNR